MKKIEGIDPKISNQIINLILEYKIPEKIIVFGSRVKGEFKKTSDIDIAIFGKAWTDRDINIIKNKLDEFIKIPLKIDVLNFYSLKKESLKEKILKEGIIFYETRKN